MAERDRVLGQLGRAIRGLREERRMSQEELGLQTGVHRNYVGGIERGERSPTVATIAVLADALGVSLGELFTRADRLD